MSHTAEDGRLVMGDTTGTATMDLLPFTVLAAATMLRFAPSWLAQLGQQRLSPYLTAAATVITLFHAAAALSDYYGRDRTLVIDGSESYVSIDHHRYHRLPDFHERIYLSRADGSRQLVYDRRGPGADRRRPALEARSLLGALSRHCSCPIRSIAGPERNSDTSDTNDTNHGPGNQPGQSALETLPSHFELVTERGTSEMRWQVCWAANLSSWGLLALLAYAMIGLRLPVAAIAILLVFAAGWWFEGQPLALFHGLRHHVMARLLPHLPTKALVFDTTRDTVEQVHHGWHRASEPAEPFTLPATDIAAVTLFLTGDERIELTLADGSRLPIFDRAPSSPFVLGAAASCTDEDELARTIADLLCCPLHTAVTDGTADEQVQTNDESPQPRDESPRGDQHG